MIRQVIKSGNRVSSTCKRCLSDSYSGDSGGSITYSGGQASTGQGGFYGSGGSRAVSGSQAQDHPEARVIVADITDLAKIMADVENLETELRVHGNTLSTKTIELKSAIKKTISNPKVQALLNRLEIKGEPVWGLSSKERDLVRAAKAMYTKS